VSPAVLVVGQQPRRRGKSSQRSSGLANRSGHHLQEVLSSRTCISLHHFVRATRTDSPRARCGVLCCGRGTPRGPTDRGAGLSADSPPPRFHASNFVSTALSLLSPFHLADSTIQTKSRVRHGADSAPVTVAFRARRSQVCEPGHVPPQSL
jgi:hypothetical protein